jgi:hypothetical protein
MANKNPPSGNDPYELRKRLTFEQAEGVEPLPEQLKLKELSQQLRSALWSVVYGSLVAARETPGIGGGPYVGIPWSTILRDMHTFRYHRMEDEFNDKFKVVVDETKAVFVEGNYLAVLAAMGFAAKRVRPSFPNRSMLLSGLDTRHIGLLTEQPSFQLVRMPSLLH